MSKITDKELLTFCNLTNLKLEFAKLSYKKEGIETKINHTIYL